MPCRTICIFHEKHLREVTESVVVVVAVINFMKYRIAYERTVNVLASSLAMVAQRLPFLKSLTPIFGATGGVNLAAPLTVTFVGTHALSGQSVTIVPQDGASETATVTVGDQFSWRFVVSQYVLRAASANTDGVLETLPEGLSFFGPDNGSGTIFLAGIPTVPGEYEITIFGYRFENRTRGTTAPYLLTLTVDPGVEEDPFAFFLTEFWAGSDLDDPALVAPTADPDGDGITNEMEFVLDLDPTKPETMPGTFGIDPDDATKMRYAIPLNVAAGAVAVSFEEGSDLQADWQDVASENVTRTDAAIVLSIPIVGKKFYRLKVMLE